MPISFIFYFLTNLFQICFPISAALYLAIFSWLPISFWYGNKKFQHLSGLWQHLFRLCDVSAVVCCGSWWLDRAFVPLHLSSYPGPRLKVSPHLGHAVLLAESRNNVRGVHSHLKLLHGAGRASQVALVIKNLPDSTRDVRDPGSIPGLGRSPGGGHGNLLQYSCLGNSIEEPGRLQSMGPQRVGCVWAPEHGGGK